jgi:sugar phosphate isomerase/epimerase
MSDAQPIAWNLSGFGDEIDPNPELQVAVLQALGARFIEVRSAWGVNVVDLDDAELAALKAILEKSGMGVSAIASPIGKVSLDGDPQEEVGRLLRIIRVAKELGTSSIRVFSFFLEGAAHGDVRSAVLQRMSLLADAAATAGVTLLHENEKGIYGDTPDRVLDIVQSVGSPALRVAWDSANFVQVGVTHPHEEGYGQLRPYLDYLQVKDAVSATGEVVPAGEGDGQVADTIRALAADGYTGFASLEPHLASAHDLGGFSGAIAFGEAARAFRRLADDAGVALR